MSSKKHSLHARVEAILDELRPFLRRDEGDVELVSIDDKKNVLLAFKGNCILCPMSHMTLRNGIATAIKSSIPEINDIDSLNN